jgi:hypothetical protein
MRVLADLLASNESKETKEIDAKLSPYVYSNTKSGTADLRVPFYKTNILRVLFFEAGFDIYGPT